jgi:DNA-binding response OmpR family regulator
VVVLAFVLAHSREQLEELIGWLHQRGVEPDVVGGGADRPAHELALDSFVAPGDVYSDGLLFVDFRQRRAELRGRELALTPLEFRLLAAFVRHPKQVLSHNQLLELAWGDARWVSREQLRLTVSYLRRKLGVDGREAIETVRGFGYRYRPTG